MKVPTEKPPHRLFCPHQGGGEKNIVSTDKLHVRRKEVPDDTGDYFVLARLTVLRKVNITYHKP